MLVRTPAICLLLAAATFAAFSPTLSNAFVNFDDTFYIVENQNVNHGLSPQGVNVAFTRIVGTNVALLLALLSKPMAVTFPAVLLLLNYWPLRRNDATWRALVLEKVPMFLLVIVVSIVAYAAQRSTGAVTDLSRIPFGLRI